MHTYTNCLTSSNFSCLWNKIASTSQDWVLNWVMRVKYNPKHNALDIAVILQIDSPMPNYPMFFSTFYDWEIQDVWCFINVLCQGNNIYQIIVLQVIRTTWVPFRFFSKMIVVISIKLCNFPFISVDPSSRNRTKLIILISLWSLASIVIHKK